MPSVSASIALSMAALSGDFDATATRMAYVVAFDRGDRQLQAGELDVAERAFEEALALWPESPAVAFELACLHSRLAETSTALTWLRRALDWGYDAPSMLACDGDLDGWRSRVEFAALVERARANRELHSSDSSAWRTIPEDRPYEEMQPGTRLRTRVASRGHQILSGEWFETTPFDSVDHGRTLLAPYDDWRVRVIDVESGTITARCDAVASRVEADSTERCFATTTVGGRELSLWSSRTFERIQTWAFENQEAHHHPREFALAPGGGQMLVWNHRGTTQLLDSLTGRVLAEFPHQLREDKYGARTCAAWSPDGSRFALGDLFGDVQVWRMADPPVLEQSLPGSARVSFLTFAPDGARVLTGGPGENAVIWDLAQARRATTLGFDSAFPIAGFTIRWAEFSADSERVAATLSDWGWVRVFDTHEARFVFEFNFENGNPLPMEARFDRDRRHVYTGGMGEGHAAAFDLRTGAMVLDLRHMHTLHLRPLRGGMYACADQDGQLVVYDTRSVRFAYRRIEQPLGACFTDAHWHVSGSPAAAASLWFTIDDEPFSVREHAPWIYDPRKVRAWRAGIDVESTIFPLPPTVELHEEPLLDRVEHRVSVRVTGSVDDVTLGPCLDAITTDARRVQIPLSRIVGSTRHAFDTLLDVSGGTTWRIRATNRAGIMSDELEVAGSSSKH